MPPPICKTDLSSQVKGMLPIAYVAGAAASGANSDITSLSGLSTPLSVAQGGTGRAIPVEFVASDYAFAAQTPGVELTAGVPATVTLSPVPDGVSGTDANHYLYISGGAGVAEAVLITGGTAISGAASGTVTFTPANNHSGAWTIKSATAGIQEAINASYDQIQGTVYIPTGYHRLKAPVWNDKSASMRGDGMTSRIFVDFATGDAINIAGQANYAGNATCQISGLSLEEGVIRTGGAMLALFWQADGFVNNIYMVTSYDGLRLSGTVRIAMSDLVIKAAHYGIHSTDVDGDHRRNEWQAANIRIIGASEAIRFDSSTTGVNIQGIFTEHDTGGYGIVLADPSPAALNEIVVNGGILDGCISCVTTSSQAQISSNGIEFANLRMSTVAGANSAIVLYRISNVKVTNCTITADRKGILLGGVSNVTVQGNSIVSSALDGNFIGISLEGMAVTKSLFAGNHSGEVPGGGYTTGKYGVLADSVAHAYNTIIGNYLVGATAPISWAGTGLGNRFANNTGVDDSIGTVASAASIALPVNPAFTVTGTTGVGAVTGLWEGREVTFITPDGVVAFTAGATIGNSFSTTQNVPVKGVVIGGKLYLR